MGITAKRRSFMPMLMPNEHLLSAVCRGIKLGTVNHWRDFLNDPKSDGSEFCSGHVLRPLYASVCAQYHGANPEMILKNHSLWHYFRSFIPGNHSAIPCIEQWPAIYNHKQNLHPLKLLRYRQTKQWRWCLECAQQDYDTYGFSYWHVEHQLPGISHCQHHPESQLRGACNSCGSQVTDIREKSVRLFPENRCPVCHTPFDDYESTPNHPIIDWVAQVTRELQLGSKLNVQTLRKDILEELGIDPTTRTAAGIRRTGIARKMIRDALPLDVINWFFQTEERGSFKAGDNISPLELKLLYDRSSFVHPLSWLIISWIVMSKNRTLDKYLIQ